MLRQEGTSPHAFIDTIHVCALHTYFAKSHRSYGKSCLLVCCPHTQKNKIKTDWSGADTQHYIATETTEYLALFFCS